MTPGHQGVRVRNVRGKSGPKKIYVYVVFFPKRDKLNGTNGFLQKYAVSCSFLRQSAVSCGFLRKYAPPKCCCSQDLQKSAKISENLRKTANSARSVPCSLSLLIALDNTCKLDGGACSGPSRMERPPFVGDKFGESLEGSQATPSFWEVPRLPRKFPELPQKFFGDFPGGSLTVELSSNPGVPRKFPRLPRKFPKLPRKFPDFPGGQPLSLGSLTPSPDSQKLSLNLGRHDTESICLNDKFCAISCHLLCETWRQY